MSNDVVEIMQVLGVEGVRRGRALGLGVNFGIKKKGGGKNKKER